MRTYALATLTLTLLGGAACVATDGDPLTKISVGVSIAQTACDLPCGVQENPFGLTFTVDNGRDHTIGTLGVGTYTSALSKGVHVVQLRRVAAPCIAPDSQVIDVDPGNEEIVAFLVVCPP